MRAHNCPLTLGDVTIRDFNKSHVEVCLCKSEDEWRRVDQIIVISDALVTFITHEEKEDPENPQTTTVNISMEARLVHDRSQCEVHPKGEDYCLCGCSRENPCYRMNCPHCRHIEYGMNHLDEALAEK